MVAATASTGGTRGIPIQTGRGITIVSPKIGWVDDGDYAAAWDSNSVSTLRLPEPWADGLINHACFNVGVQELATINADGSVTARPANLDAALAPAYAYNAARTAGGQVTVHVRIHWGERAYTGMDRFTGSVAMSDGSFGKNSRVPIWWTPPYRALQEKIYAAIAPMIDARPIIGSVNSGMAALFYPEPFLLFGSSEVSPGVTNQDSLVAAGWTAAAHRDYLLWAAGIPGKYFRRVVVYLALNPTTFPTESSADMPFMWQVADAHLASLPTWRGGLENYSMRMSYTSGPGNYPAMYAGIGARTCWRATQMARAHRVADTQDGDTYCGWPEVAIKTGQWGFHAVETTGRTTAGGAANGYPNSYVTRTSDMRASDALFAGNTNRARTW